MTTEAGVAPTDSRGWSGALSARWPRLLVNLRARILFWYVGPLLLATIASVFLARQLLVDRLDDRINDQLTQEAVELNRLAAGRDPRTGTPFGANVDRIFDVFYRRNVPARNEMMLTFVEGEPYKFSPPDPPFRLDREDDLMGRWSTLERPERGRTETPVGAVDYLAVPLLGEDDRALGVFVITVFRDLERVDIDGGVQAVAGVGLAMLLIGSVLALNLAQRLLGPVKAVTQTAHSISESDLTRRIEVSGRDEISELTTTFNDMLDRLETAFAGQRDFVNDAGHELRTPITVIRGHLELLEDDPQERRATVDLVMDELDRMNRIVNDLLLLAKSEHSDFLDLETVDVSTLTNELHDKGGALAVRDWVLDEVGRGVIVADRQRLTQAIMQLAQNAVQHTFEGQRISLGSRVSDGEARFWVQDTGPGIPVEDRERIFERFARARGSRRSSGAGLGLSIVRAIAEAHRGRVEVISRVGVGSTFIMVIPVDQPQAEATEGQV